MDHGKRYSLHPHYSECRRKTSGMGSSAADPIDLEDAIVAVPAGYASKTTARRPARKAVAKRRAVAAMRAGTDDVDGEERGVGVARGVEDEVMMGGIVGEASGIAAVVAGDAETAMDVAEESVDIREGTTATVGDIGMTENVMGEFDDEREDVAAAGEGGLAWNVMEEASDRGKMLLLCSPKQEVLGEKEFLSGRPKRGQRRNRGATWQRREMLEELVELIWRGILWPMVEGLRHPPLFFCIFA